VPWPCLLFFNDSCLYSQTITDTNPATQIKYLTPPGFFFSPSLEEEEVILDLYPLKSDSVILSILSPVLVLLQSHPNKFHGCRKRLVSTATYSRELKRLCTLLLTHQLHVLEIVITVLQVLLQHIYHQKHSHTIGGFVKKNSLRKYISLHTFCVT